LHGSYGAFTPWGKENRSPQFAPHPRQPATIWDNLSHFLVDVFVEMLEKPIKFLNETAKGDGFAPHNNSVLLQLWRKWLKSCRFLRAPTATRFEPTGGANGTNWLKSHTRAIKFPEGFFPHVPLN
jgi:hypothetical protein